MWFPSWNKFVFLPTKNARMKKVLSVVILIVTLVIAHAQVPNGYYNSAVGKSGEELRTALYNIIKQHTCVEYNYLWTAFRTTDVMASGKVWDIYSDNPTGTTAYYYVFGSNQCGSYSQEGNCYNREHSVPQSWFNDALPMKTDLFHLYPTDGWVNNKRDNWPYGEVDPSAPASAIWTSTNGSKLGPCSYPGCSGTVFEPIDAYKGDLARSYFYMTVCYKDKNLGQASESMFSGSQLVDWAQNMLVSWHEDDPVSEKEINRNNVIYNTIQHNRNPFIDCPELVDYLFGSRQNTPWYPTCVEWNPDDIENYHLADYQDCKVYPNPANQYFNIESNYLNINKIEIFDIAGRLLSSEENLNTKQFTFSTQNLNSGCFFVKITTSKTAQTVKLIKQ